MVLRHHNEAESLNAVQKMDWEWKLGEIPGAKVNNRNLSKKQDCIKFLIPPAPHGEGCGGGDFWEENKDLKKNWDQEEKIYEKGDGEYIQLNMLLCSNLYIFAN